MTCRWRWWSALATAAGLLVAGCASSSAPTPTDASPAVVTPMTLKVMEFNIEYGGSVVDFAGVPNAIKAAAPDVVAVEEGYGRIPVIAAALGWPYYDVRTQVVSRYPLLSRSDEGHYDLVEVAPGRVVALANVHLPSAPYGPNLAVRGVPPDRLVAVEDRARMPMARDYLHAVAPLVAAGVPTIVAGDFNVPSYRDWTRATVGLRDQITAPVHWPVSAAVEEAGFVDSYRAVHPDPVSDPGLTWPANRARAGSYNPYPRGAPRDRIDFIYLSGATPTASIVVGEPGTPGVDLTSTPWPSDHHAVVTTMSLTPAPAGPLVSVDQRRVIVGQPLVVRYVGSPPDGGVVRVRQAGLADPLVPTPVGSADGTVELDTTTWSPGRHTVELGLDDGTAVASTSVWVETSPRPVLRTDRSVYRAGTPIRIRWTGAPGNRWDWVSIYPYHVRTTSAAYRQWLYTGASIDGRTRIDATTGGGTWPLAPGRYTVHLLVDDSYRSVAATDIRVVR